MTGHDLVLQDVRRGMIPAHIYNDEEISRLERERLFSRAWVFVGHTAEIPQPGDYVVRRVLENSFIVGRGEDGEVRALLNMCLHRGMQVCRAEMGNASHFRCPYRGWSVDPSDRRRRVISLTGTGRSASDELARSAAKIETDFLHGLDPADQAELNRLLRALHASMTP
jgi:nitrite reductase/ring-hydroxylating ferredoxin subunit